MMVMVIGDTDGDSGYDIERDGKIGSDSESHSAADSC